MRNQAESAGGSPVVIVVSSASPQSGEPFDDRFGVLLQADAIIGATHHSIMTTRAIRDAVAVGARFLSIPLSTNDGISLLATDFISMDIEESGRMGALIARHFTGASAVRVRTGLGTDLSLSVGGRNGHIFKGLCDRPGISTSSSFEYSISVVEDRTEGVLVLDGSMGYIGLVDEPVALRFERGSLVSIQDNASGRRLREYLATFHDPRMHVAGEFGIGLNTTARCAGRSYIEDESAYGTFHIGLGRNIALGGVHYANGHFDLVAHRPDIEVDGVRIMRSGALAE